MIEKWNSSNKNEVKKKHGTQTNLFFFFWEGRCLRQHASKHVGFWEHRGETVRISFPELDKVWESKILRKDHKAILGGGFKDLLFPPIW